MIRCDLVTGDRCQSDKPPPLGQTSFSQRKSRQRRAEEAVIATTGIKEAAKNEWTSNVRCCISRALRAWYMVHAVRTEVPGRGIATITSGPVS